MNSILFNPIKSGPFSQKDTRWLFNDSFSSFILRKLGWEGQTTVTKFLNLCYSLGGRDAFIQPFFYKRFDRFSL